jgi:hypothetical protein
MSISAKVHSATYQVTPRTISRWRAQGVDPSDAVQVAEYLMKLRNPSRAAMRVVRDLLIAELLKPLSKNQPTK